MTSVYKYTDKSALELYTVTDYDLVDASYTDKVIEAWISQSERLINVYLGTTFTGTIPDGVVYAALEISMKIAWNRLLFDGFVNKETMPPYKQPYIDADLKQILDKYKASDITPIKLHRMYNNDPAVYY